MAPNELYKYFSFCLNVGIRIYPKPVVANGSILKIIIENNGKEKTGEEKYKSDLVHHKISELYKNIYEKLMKKQQSTIKT